MCLNIIGKEWISIDDIYPFPVKRLYYTNESGWGNPGSMDLPDNAIKLEHFREDNAQAAPERGRPRGACALFSEQGQGLICAHGAKNI